MNDSKRDHRTVLVLDDDDELRKSTRRVLQLRGFHVIEAATAHEAFVAVDEHSDPIDLLLCDLVLPGLEGREAAGIIQLKRPDISVLFTSGHLRHASGRQELIDAGVPFLQKPFDVPGLLSAVDAAFAHDPLA